MMSTTKPDVQATAINETGEDAALRTNETPSHTSILWLSQIVGLHRIPNFPRSSGAKMAAYITDFVSNIFYMHMLPLFYLQCQLRTASS
jgi:hypothetical protein